MHLPYKADKVFSFYVCEMLGTIHDHYSSFINSLGITKCWCSNSQFYLFHLLAKIKSHFVIVNSLVTLSYSMYRNGRGNSYFFNLKHFFPLLYYFCQAKWHVESLFPDQGSDPYSLHWKCGVLTTGPPVKSLFHFFFLIYVLCCSVVDLECFRCTARWFNYM